MPPSPFPSYAPLVLPSPAIRCCICVVFMWLFKGCCCISAWEACRGGPKLASMGIRNSFVGVRSSRMERQETVGSHKPCRSSDVQGLIYTRCRVQPNRLTNPGDYHMTPQNTPRFVKLKVLSESGRRALSVRIEVSSRQVGVSS